MGWVCWCVNEVYIEVTGDMGVGVWMGVCLWMWVGGWMIELWTSDKVYADTHYKHEYSVRNSIWSKTE